MIRIAITAAAFDAIAATAQVDPSARTSIEKGPAHGNVDGAVTRRQGGCRWASRR